jgi:hypothetical protein
MFEKGLEIFVLQKFALWLGNQVEKSSSWILVLLISFFPVLQETSFR